MKNHPSLTLRNVTFVLLLLFGVSSSGFALAFDIQYPPTIFKTLANGMEMVIRPDHASPLVALQIWVKAGSIYEDEWLGAGLSHYVEHLAFKGPEGSGEGEVARRIQQLGGEVNAYTSLDHTVFYIKVPSEHWREALESLAELVLGVGFDPGEMAREKEVILKEINMGMDDPGRRLNRLLWSTAFQVHPYRYPVIGYRGIFQDLEGEEVISYYRKRYVPNNMFLVAVGAVGADEFVAAAEEIFAPYPRKTYPLISVPPEPPQILAREAEEKMDVAEARLAMGFHIPSLHHPDLYPLDVLAILMGQGKSSSLWRKVRREMGLVHSVSAYSYTPAYPGLLVISATLDEEKLEAARSAILEVVEDYQEKEVTRDELEKARRRVISDHLQSLTTVEGQARDIGSNQLVAGNWDFSREYVRGISRVSAEDIRRVARSYLNDDNMTTVTIRPLGESGAAVSPSPEVKSEIDKLVLENGLTLLVRPDHSLPLVSLRMVFLGGVLAEDEKTSGIFNFLSRMLLQGTENLSADEIALRIEDRGGSIDAYSGRNSFGCSLEVMSDQLEPALEMLGDILRNSTFPPERMEKERNTILAQIRAEEDQPQGKAFRVFRQEIYGNHPYSFSPRGSEEAVEGLQRGDLLHFYQRYCRASNGVLAVFGDIETETLLPTVEKYLGKLPEGERAQISGIHGFPPPSVRLRQEEKEGIAQVVLLLGFPGVDFYHPDRYPLEVLASVVSGLASPLFGKVRGDMGLAYYVGGFQRVGLDPGAFVFYAGTVPGKSEEVVSAIWEEVGRLKKEGVGEEELERNKNLLRARHQFELQANSGLAFKSALDELYGLGCADYKNYQSRIDKVSADDLRRVANKYFSDGNYVLVVIRPEGEEGKDH